MRNLIYKTLLNGLHFSGVSALFDFWIGGRGAILMLHHVRPADQREQRFNPNSHLEVTPEFLDSLLAYLGRRGFDFVSLDEMSDRIKRPAADTENRMIAITLDDAYRDNKEYAAPIFAKHAAPYTIFVAPGLVDGRARLWWEDLANIVAKCDQLSLDLGGSIERFEISDDKSKRKTFNELLQWLTQKVSETEQRRIVEELAWMNKVDTKNHAANEIMTWKEIRDLSADPLCNFGAHTIHHYAIARLDAVEARWEMKESARIVEAEIAKPVEHFAYPYGYPAAAGKRDFDIAEELGFKSAVTTRHGVLHDEHAQSMHALPRISLNGAFQTRRYTSVLLGGIPTLLTNRGSKSNIA